MTGAPANVATAAAPKVSVCVITYNQKRYIRQCLQSLVEQRTNFPFEVIVGDDSSTDGTQDIVLEFAARYPQIVRPHLQPRNTGGSRNYLDVHAAASGEYVAHVDGDDYALPGKLQTQADALDRDPGCHAVWHRVDFFDDHGGFCPGTSADLSSFRDGRVSFEDGIRLGFVSVHSSLMYRRSARSAAAMDRPVLDVHLTWDLLSKGHGRVVPEVLGRYRVAASGSLMSAQRMRIRRLAIQHAAEFLASHPEQRRAFFVWALCSALIDLKNGQRSALDCLRFAWRTRGRLWPAEVVANLRRMRATQVRWRDRAQLAGGSA